MGAAANLVLVRRVIVYRIPLPVCALSLGSENLDNVQPSTF